jgi:membrane-associated phospholipid phosphatase
MLPRAVRLSTAIKGVAWGAVAVGVAAPLVRRKLHLKPPVVAGLAATAPLAVCIVTPRSRKRDLAVCALQMWAYLSLYEMPNDDPEKLKARVRVKYPVVIDRFIGMGQLPGVRLQKLFSKPAGLRRMDAVLVGAHWVWFFVPHTVLAYLLLVRRSRFERAAVMTYAVFDFGALVYWALPTAPPWYAAQQGVIEAQEATEPALRRLMVEQGEEFWGDRWEPLFDALAGNPLAAMPSLHFATSAMAAFLLADAGPIEGFVGWSYALTLGFALVYLGEHYVVDLLAGMGLVLGVRALERPLTPLLRGVSNTVNALEARVSG